MILIDSRAAIAEIKFSIDRGKKNSLLFLQFDILYQFFYLNKNIYIKTNYFLLLFLDDATGGGEGEGKGEGARGESSPIVLRLL